MLKITYEDLLKNLKEELQQTETYLEAWKKVKIHRKKDGGEYKTLSKNCVEGANINKNANMTDISVTCLTMTGGWRTDSIRANDFNVPGFPQMAPEKVREAVEMHIAYLQKRKEETEKEIRESRQAYDRVDAATKSLAMALKDLSEGGRLYKDIVDSVPNARSLRWHV